MIFPSKWNKCDLSQLRFRWFFFMKCFQILFTLSKMYDFHSFISLLIYSALFWSIELLIFLELWNLLTSFFPHRILLCHDIVSLFILESIFRTGSHLNVFQRYFCFIYRTLPKCCSGTHSFKCMVIFQDLCKNVKKLRISAETTKKILILILNRDTDFYMHCTSVVRLCCNNLCLPTMKDECAVHLPLFEVLHSMRSQIWRDVINNSTIQNFSNEFSKSLC